MPSGFKESIFTGLNNFKVYSADDVRYDEEFGFTNEEVKIAGRLQSAEAFHRSEGMV